VDFGAKCLKNRDYGGILLCGAMSLYGAMKIALITFVNIAVANRDCIDKNGHLWV
jgi:hypothetical protein